MSKTPQNLRISFEVPDDMREWLTNVAKKDEMGISLVLRRIIREKMADKKAASK